jgi:hypothetical protein
MISEKLFLDSKAFLITILTILGCLYFFYRLINFIIHSQNEILSISFLTYNLPFFFLLLIIVFCFLSSPTIIKINNNNSLIISSRIKNQEIPIKDIKHIRTFSKVELNQLKREFAVGGLFGYFGDYSTEKNQKVKIYFRSMNEGILIETFSGQTIIIEKKERIFKKISNVIHN